MLSKFDIEYLKTRIIEYPLPPFPPLIDYIGMTDEEKLIAYLLSYYCRDYAVTKIKDIRSYFKWTSGKLANVRISINNSQKNINIDLVLLTDHKTGILDQKGYYLNIKDYVF